MRDVLTTIGELSGGVLVAIGFGMFAPALGVLVGGIALAGFSWLASR